MFLEMNIRIQPPFPPFKDEFDDTMKKDLKELDKIFGKFVKSKTKSEIMYTVTEYEKIISPLLKEYLVKNNVSEQYFRPVYSKRTSKDVFAYQVTGKGSVLPPLSYMPSLDNYLLECKFHHLYEIYEKSDSRGVYENTKYENIISYAAAKQRRYITKEAYDLLDDINEVYETIERNRVILFNRRTFQLLLDRVPNIKKYSIPVFLLEKVPKNVWEKR